MHLGKKPRLRRFRFVAGPKKCNVAAINSDSSGFYYIFIWYICKKNA